MAKQHIKIGDTPNDRTGDPLREAFRKVNENFDELYAAGNPIQYHLGDDLQFVDINPDTGIVVIQSGFDTGMPVYIKGANCADEGVGGNVIIEAGGAPLPNNGTTGNIELAAQQTTIESNNNMWSFRDDGVLELPLGGDIVDSDGYTVLGGAGGATDRLVNGDAELVLENDGTITSVAFPARDGGRIGLSGVEIIAVPADPADTSPTPLVLSSQQGEVRISSNAQGPRPVWSFKQNGTIDVPVPQGELFTLTLSSANFIPRVGKSTLTLSGAPWVLQGQIQRNADGSAELQLNQIFPKISNPGYVSDDTFTFDDQVHHLFGFDLEIGLADVVEAGPAGWTANLQANQLPDYPSTVNSDGAIKLTANENSWTFGTNGGLTFPQGTFLGYSDPGGFIIDGAVDKDIAIYTYSGADAHGWTFGTDGTLTVPGDIKSAAGVGPVVIEANDGTARTWTFGGDGTLNLPESVSAGNAILQTTSAINIQVNSNAHEWTFGTDGLLTFPGAAGYQATFGSVEPVGDVLHSINDLVLKSDHGVTIVSGEGIDALQTTYNDYRIQLANAFEAELWTGAGYPASHTSVGPLTSEKMLNPGIPDFWITLANSVSNAWDDWQEALNTSGIDIGVGDHGWHFGSNGTLTLPAGGDIKNSAGASVLGATLTLQSKPTTKEGQAGDLKGMIAIDSIGGEFYYCIADYTDGADPIWAKVAGSTSWI